MRYRISGQARSVKGAEARRKIQRLMHGAALEITTDGVSADWRYDLRRGRLHIYGGLLRYIDVALKQGKSRDELHRIPQWIAAYIDDVSEPTNTAELKLVA